MPEAPAAPDAEWLVEDGIGEERAVRLVGGAVTAARLAWPGALAVGEIGDARVVARAAGSGRATLRLPGGDEALIDRLPASVTEGASVRVAITRAAITERGRLKRALARLSDDAPRAAPSVCDALTAEGQIARPVRRLPEGAWEEVFADAWDGMLAFPGGGLIVTPAPGLTVIDIDGTLAPLPLALAAAVAVGAAIARFDLAGAIGIDFPTLANRADRQAVDRALAGALVDWSHERTGMNGFGLVQLVARLTRPSLLHRIAADRPGAAARLLLRRAEHVGAPGALLLTAHPAVIGAVRPDWRAALARRTGRALRWREDAALAVDGGFVQAVTP